MKHYVMLTLACLTVAACGSNEPTFATQVKARGTTFDGIATSWDKGEAMIHKGNDLVKQGQEEYEKGRSLSEKGNQHVLEGNASIEQGRQLKIAAEVQYHQMRTTPYNGSLPQ